MSPIWTSDTGRRDFLKYAAAAGAASWGVLPQGAMAQGAPINL